MNSLHLESSGLRGGAHHWVNFRAESLIWEVVTITCIKSYLHSEASDYNDKHCFQKNENALLRNKKCGNAKLL